MWESFVSSTWSSRSPGGPLFSSDIFKNNVDNYSELSKWKLEDCVFGFKEHIVGDKVLNGLSKLSPTARVDEIRTKLNAEIVNFGGERSRRRRPTYSPKMVRALSRESSGSVDSTSDSEEYTASSKDLRERKILEFRKLLTRTIKIKTTLLSEKVRVMCSTNGENIEWYKSRSEAENHRKPDGYIPVSKINNVTTKSDNIKHLEIFVGSTSFIFVFRSREEREQWQTDFKKFQKFMQLVK